MCSERIPETTVPKSGTQTLPACGSNLPIRQRSRCARETVELAVRTICARRSVGVTRRPFASRFSPVSTTSAVIAPIPRAYLEIGTAATWHPGPRLQSSTAESGRKRQISARLVVEWSNCGHGHSPTSKITRTGRWHPGTGGKLGRASNVCRLRFLAQNIAGLSRLLQLGRDAELLRRYRGPLARHKSLVLRTRLNPSTQHVVNVPRDGRTVATYSRKVLASA